MIFEQGTLRFYLALGLANYVVCVCLEAWEPGGSDFNRNREVGNKNMSGKKVSWVSTRAVCNSDQPGGEVQWEVGNASKNNASKNIDERS